MRGNAGRLVVGFLVLIANQAHTPAANAGDHADPIALDPLLTIIERGKPEARDRDGRGGDHRNHKARHMARDPSGQQVARDREQRRAEREQRVGVEGLSAWTHDDENADEAHDRRTPGSGNHAD